MARVAFEFIRYIRSEQADAKVEKVIVESEDITEYMKKHLKNTIYDYLFL